MMTPAIKAQTVAIALPPNKTMSQLRWAYPRVRGAPKEKWVRDNSLFSELDVEPMEWALSQCLQPLELRGQRVQVDNPRTGARPSLVALAEPGVDVLSG